jgi:hypothetical protein
MLLEITKENVFSGFVVQMKPPTPCLVWLKHSEDMSDSCRSSDAHVSLLFLFVGGCVCMKTFEVDARFLRTCVGAVGVIFYQVSELSRTRASAAPRHNLTTSAKAEVVNATTLTKQVRFSPTQTIVGFHVPAR